MKALTTQLAAWIESFAGGALGGAPPAAAQYTNGILSPSRNRRPAGANKAYMRAAHKARNARKHRRAQHG